MKATEVDVLIIGAGPAGAIAAATLQRAGFRLLVVEKQVFPRFVIGESLLPHSMDLLQEAGLLDSVERQGFMRKYGAVFLRGAETCNFDFANQAGPGWKYTYQVTRADFDKTLADAVAARGVEICYGHSVTAVNFEDARACDARPAGREEGKVWVCLHPGGAWTWLIPFSNGRTSVGVVAEPDFFRQYPGSPEEQIRSIFMSDPNAASRLASAQLVFPPQRISGYACAVKRLWGPRFALAGNATEFLDPIFSSGVTLALESAHRAAQVLTRHLRGQPADWQTEYADYVMQGMNTFRSYVAAWYDDKLPQIFFAAQRNPDIMGQICAVLAGYVWDQSNPYVTQADRALSVLASLVGKRASRAGG
jgi:flavin-dependent dehydrogenase